MKQEQKHHEINQQKYHKGRTFEHLTHYHRTKQQFQRKIFHLKGTALENKFPDPHVIYHMKFGEFEVSLFPTTCA